MKVVLPAERRIFSNMPSTALLSTLEGREQFKEQLEKINTNKEEIYIKNIAAIIYEKLTSKDPEYSWTSKEYSNLKKYFINIDSEIMNVIGESIEKCLKAPNSEIYKELQLFSQQIRWYPPKQKIKEEKSNKYSWQSKEIELSDCFFIINNLVSYMYQYISQYANKAVQELRNEQDISTILEPIQEEFFQTFDEKFQFITNYPLFADIYTKMRQKILTELIQKIYLNNGIIQKQKEKYTRWGSDKEDQVKGLSSNLFSRAYRKKN